MRIILASESPRRKELLKLMGLTYTVEPSDIAETPPEHATVAETVQALALQKAKTIFQKHPDACVIGADTVVDLDGVILGKPHTPEHAREYLSRMQGRWHVVYTGVAVLTPDSSDVRCCTTNVKFAPMSQAEIDWYVSTGEPLDKAGAYGVQGPGGVFVERVDGNYFNVIGLPLPLLYAMLKDAHVLTENRS